MKNLKKIFKISFPIILACIGAFAVIFGELDDSPGLGGIGLIIITSALILNLKNFNSKQS